MSEVGYLVFSCRDIGYGIEEGQGEYVRRPGLAVAGKVTFDPIGDGETIYLFEDEILEWNQT